ERQRLDLQEVGVPQVTIERYAERVRRQLGVEPGAQPAKAMSMVDFDPELLRQLPIHGLDDRPHRLHLPADPFGELPFLVAPRAPCAAHSPEQCGTQWNFTTGTGRLSITPRGSWATSSPRSNTWRTTLIASANWRRRRLKRLRSGRRGNNWGYSRQWRKSTVSSSQPRHSPTSARVISSLSEQTGSGPGRGKRGASWRQRSSMST